MSVDLLLRFLVFFNDTATTEIYTLSLHDALPILHPPVPFRNRQNQPQFSHRQRAELDGGDRSGIRLDLQPSPSRHADRKSTRLNSSHANISYAVFCLKKKKRIVQCRQWANFLSSL